MSRNSKLNTNDVTRAATRAVVASMKKFGVSVSLVSAEYNWLTKKEDAIGQCLVELTTESVEAPFEQFQHEVLLQRDGAQGWVVTSLRRLKMGLNIEIATTGISVERFGLIVEVVTRINAGESFAWVCGNDQGDWLDYIVLRDDKSIPLKTFMKAAGLELGDNTQNQIKQLFGTQFIGFFPNQLDNSGFRQMMIVTVIKGEISVLAEHGEETFRRGKAALFNPQHSDALIRDELEGEADGIYVLEAKDLPEMQAALDLARKLRAQFIVDGELPYTLEEVWMVVDAETTKVPTGELTEWHETQRMMLWWGLNLLAYRHLKQWVFIEDAIRHRDFFMFYSAFRAEYFSHEQWPSNTQEFLAIARAFFDGRSLFISLEGFKSVTVFEDPQTGFTFSTKKYVPRSAVDANSANADLWAKHFGSEGWAKHPRTYSYPALPEDNMYVVP